MHFNFNLLASSHPGTFKTLLSNMLMLLVCTVWGLSVDTVSTFLANRKKTLYLCEEEEEECSSSSTAPQQSRSSAHIYDPSNGVDLWSLGGISQKGHPSMLVKILECFSTPRPVSDLRFAFMIDAHEKPSAVHLNVTTVLLLQRYEG